MKSPFIVRKLRVTDSHNLGKFFLSLSKVSKTTFQPHPLTTVFAKKIASNSNSQYKLRLVLIENKSNNIIGYSFSHKYMLFPKKAYFGIAILDAFQGQGLGTTLLKETLRFSKDQGISVLYLNVFASNKAGLALYEKVGFEVCPPPPLSSIQTVFELLFNGTLYSTLFTLFMPRKSHSHKNPGKVVWMRKLLV